MCFLLCTSILRHNSWVIGKKRKFLDSIKSTFSKSFFWPTVRIANHTTFFSIARNSKSKTQQIIYILLVSCLVVICVSSVIPVNHIVFEAADPLTESRCSKENLFGCFPLVYFSLSSYLLHFECVYGKIYPSNKIFWFRLFLHSSSKENYCFRQNVASRPGEVILSLCSALVRHIFRLLGTAMGSLVQERHGVIIATPAQGHKR